MNIRRYQALSNIIQEITDEQREQLQKRQRSITLEHEAVSQKLQKLKSASQSIGEAANSTTRYAHRELDSLDDMEQTRDKLAHALRGEQNLIHVMSNLYTGLDQAWSMLEDIAISLDAGELIRIEDKPENDREKLQDMSVEFSLNESACVVFENGIKKLTDYRHILLDMAAQIVRVMEKFSEELTERHSKDGIKIHYSPVLTDFAMTIYDNVAHHGNMTEHTTESVLTAYSANKAIAVVNLMKDDRLRDILTSESARMSTLVIQDLRSLWKQAKALEELFADEMKEVLKIQYKRFIEPSERTFENRLDNLATLDPNKVKYFDTSANMTEEEIRDLEHKNDVLLEVCRKLRTSDLSADEIVTYVHEQVKRLRDHYLNVNSFYVCRIGQGNPMMGKSSGHLEIIPGKKPSSKFEDIIGTGFDEVRDFAEHIKRMKKYADLFLMTSPRRTHDRANVLLIGPQGCGKTEALRAVANDEDSIAIFAQGSDFLTSWMGEAQKNPKRLFEAAVKLQKESEKHVHILIDEIDSVINDDFSTTKINLTLEFQMIMDGIVEYPNISVWGTTNHPEKIPMPMIRRFAKLLIVGELDLPQRIQLLKHFFTNLPLEEISEEAWKAKAKRLEHCTGDVVRKIADHVWREQMSRFIQEKPDDAERMVDTIRQINLKGFGEKYQPELDAKRADESMNRRSYGGKDATRRDMFLKQFKRVWAIEESAIDAAIDAALDNIGIINEIETAKKTYADAKTFLANIRNERERNSQSK